MNPLDKDERDLAERTQEGVWEIAHRVCDDHGFTADARTKNSKTDSTRPEAIHNRGE